MERHSYCSRPRWGSFGLVVMASSLVLLHCGDDTHSADQADADQSAPTDLGETTPDVDLEDFDRELSEDPQSDISDALDSSDSIDEPDVDPADGDPIDEPDIDPDGVDLTPDGDEPDLGPGSLQLSGGLVPLGGSATGDGLWLRGHLSNVAPTHSHGGSYSLEHIGLSGR